MSQLGSLIGPARDKVARGDLAVHDHVCGMYETREAQYEAASRFLEVGLARQEQCLYIAEHHTPAEFRAFLEARVPNAVEATRIGALKVVSGKSVRFELGGFTPAAMLSFLADSAKMAKAIGFSALRLCADMTWLKQDDIPTMDFFSYESQLNGFFLNHAIVGLCQYGMADFKSELLIAAAETHPLLVYNDVVCDNFYYIPPEEYLKPRFSDAKLRRILGNIITRERLMQTFLSS